MSQLFHSYRLCFFYQLCRQTGQYKRKGKNELRKGRWDRWWTIRHRKKRKRTERGETDWENLEIKEIDKRIKGGVYVLLSRLIMIIRDSSDVAFPTVLVVGLSRSLINHPDRLLRTSRLPFRLMHLFLQPRGDGDCSFSFFCPFQSYFTEPTKEKNQSRWAL